MSKTAAVFCPNPGIDRVYYVDSHLYAGNLYRTGRAEICLGSKGANAALALKKEGVRVTVYTFSGGTAGEMAEKMLLARGVKVITIPTACGVRENVKLVEPDGKTTEINELGGPVGEEETERLLSLLEKGRYDALLLCGSLPEGLPSDIYARVIAMANEKGAKTFLDSSGAALAAGTCGQPDYIKPNAAELAELAGEPVPHTLKNVAALAQKWHESHPEVRVICTAGKKGAVYAGEEGVFVRQAPEVEVRTTVGAGDAFLAGFVASVLRGEEPDESMEAATACAVDHIEVKKPPEIPGLEDFPEENGEESAEKTAGETGGENSGEAGAEEQEDSSDFPYHRNPPDPEKLAELSKTADFMTLLQELFRDFPKNDSDADDTFAEECRYSLQEKQAEKNGNAGEPGKRRGRGRPKNSDRN